MAAANTIKHAPHPLRQSLVSRSWLAALVATVSAAALSACAYFEKAAVPENQRLINEQSFIAQKQHSRPLQPLLPLAVKPDKQRRIKLLSSTPQQHETTASPLISAKLSDVPLHIFTSMLSDLSDYNILVAPDIDDVVNHNLNRIGWREALRTIAELHGIAVDEDTDQRLIRLYKHTAQGITSSARNDSRWTSQQQMELFKLRYADPEKIATLLKSVLSEQQQDKHAGTVQSSIISDKNSHSLIVQGDRHTLDLVASLLDTMDVPQRQVMIEAFIVEAGADFTRALGARLGKHKGGLFAVDNLNGPYLNLPVVGAGGGLGLTFGSARIRIELSALEKAGKSRLISNPKIFTLDNQSAMIFEGSEVPYQTLSDHGTQTEFKQAGLKLAVTPVIVNENHLMLDVAINKDTVDTRLQNPPITRRELTSRLLVRSGDVIAIGGIYLKQQVRSFEGVPFISYLPFIGDWLQHKRREGNIKELVVFIAPQIV